MARTFNVKEAKANLSELLKRVELGEEIIIAKARKPVARLVPYAKSTPQTLCLKRRKPGSAEGLIFIRDDFDDPLPPEIQKYFG